MQRGCKKLKREFVFPRLVIELFMRFLPVKDVLALSSVNKRYYKVSKSQRLWVWLVRRDFGDIRRLEIDDCMREVYKEEYKIDYPYDMSNDYWKSFTAVVVRRLMGYSSNIWCPATYVKCALRHTLDVKEFVENFDILLKSTLRSNNVTILDILCRDKRLWQHCTVSEDVIKQAIVCNNVACLQLILQHFHSPISNSVLRCAAWESSRIFNVVLNCPLFGFNACITEDILKKCIRGEDCEDYDHDTFCAVLWRIVYYHPHTFIELFLSHFGIGVTDRDICAATDAGFVNLQKLFYRRVKGVYELKREFFVKKIKLTPL